jgi:hypothetical protein
MAVVHPNPNHSIVGCVRVRDDLFGSIDPFDWDKRMKPKIGPVLPFASCYHRVPCERPSKRYPGQNSCASCDTPIWHRPPMLLVKEVTQMPVTRYKKSWLQVGLGTCDSLVPILQTNLFPLPCLSPLKTTDLDTQINCFFGSRKCTFISRVTCRLPMSNFCGFSASCLHNLIYKSGYI